MSNETTQPAGGGTRQVSLVGPLILIFLGIILLSNTLGYLGWSIWGQVWKLWPVVLILLGLDIIFGRHWLHITVPDYPPPPHSGRVVGATILILLGLLFLLGNLGLIGWSVWSAVWRLWPITLIAIGLDRLLGRIFRVGRYVSLVLVVALLAAAVWSLGAGDVSGQLLAGESISQPVGSAARAVVDLRPSVGTVRITGGAAAGQLVEGRVDRSGGERVSSEASNNGDTLYYTLKAQDLPNFFVWGGRPDLTWDLRLSDQIPTQLSLHTGVGQSTIDLSTLKLSSLEVNTGIGETTITLPKQGQVTGTVHGGIGKTTVRVPRNMAVRLRLRTGIGDVQVPSGLQWQGGYYVSPNYDSAADRIDLEINGGIGEIRVIDAGV